MAAVDGTDEIVLNLDGYLCRRRSHILDDDLDALWLYNLILVVEGLLPVLSHFLEGIDILFRQRQHRLGLEGDCVAHVAAVPGAETSVQLVDGVEHDASHQFVGVAATFVNLQSGVTAAQSFHRDADGDVILVGLHLLIVQRGGDVDATGRADDELAPVLRVEVHQNIALQFALRQLVSTIHARLFVACNQSVDGSVLQVLSLHDSHDGSHPQTVVGTERCTLGLHPLAVNPRLDGVRLEVVVRLRRLLRHHVHVGLQDNAFLMLVAGSSGLAEYDVAGGVLESLDAGLLAEVEQELLYFL